MKKLNNILRDLCNHKISLTDAESMITELFKSLPNGSVLTAFKQPWKIGNSVQIIANHNGHGFDIGEIVTIQAFNETQSVLGNVVNEWYAINDRNDYWYILECDANLVQPLPSSESIANSTNTLDSEILSQLVASVNNQFVKDVNRVEVIDNKGRSYVNWKDNNKVQLDLQDRGRTLKIFINEHI